MEKLTQEVYGERIMIAATQTQITTLNVFGAPSTDTSYEERDYNWLRSELVSSLEGTFDSLTDLLPELEDFYSDEDWYTFCLFTVAVNIEILL